MEYLGYYNARKDTVLCELGDEEFKILSRIAGALDQERPVGSMLDYGPVFRLLSSLMEEIERAAEIGEEVFVKVVAERLEDK